MDFRKIDNILPKYWEGDTSLNEEVILYSYFTSNNVHESHEVYVPYFKTQQSYRNKKAPVEIATSINEKIGGNKVRKISSYKKFWRIAAAIGVLTVGAVLYQQYVLPVESNSELYSDTFETPEEALQEIKMALGMVSNKIEESTIMVSNEIIKIDISNNVLY